MRLLTASLVLIFSIFAFPANALEQSGVALRAEKIVSGWESWINKHEITRAALAVSYYGNIVAKHSIGMEVDEAAPVASLSKAITGICVGKLVDAGLITYASNVDEVLPELDSNISIAALLSHISGYTHDVTQEPLKYIGRDREYLEWISEAEIAQGRDKSMVGRFSYNNSNYAMLGAIIRKLTGKTYESACNEFVLQPAGVTKARLNEPWRIMAAWGGWRMSAAEYLSFVDAYFDQTTVLGHSPEVLPHHVFDSGIRYGMGYLFRAGRNGGFNFWHQGAWDYEWNNETARFGAYFVRFDNGWTIVINHNSSTLNGEIAEIDQLLGEATHGPL